MLSRSATGLMARAGAERGMSDFVAVTNLAFGEFAVELAAPEAALPPEPAVGLLALAPPAVLGPEVTLEAGFAGELLAGLTLTVAAAGPAALGAEADAGLGAGDAGLAGEVGGAAGFGVCTFEAAEADGFAGATFVPVAGLAGAGVFNALRSASGVAGACCAAKGLATEARQKTATQLIKFAFRMMLYRRCIFNSIPPYFATAAPGRAAVLEPAGGPAGVLVVKNVVMVHVPLTVVLGRTG